MVGGDSGLPDKAAVEAMCRNVRCRVFVAHGTLDAINPLERGKRLAELTGAELALLEGSGHAPTARDPVKVNLMLRDFAEKGDRPPAAHPKVDPGGRPAEACALYLLADRPRPRLARHRNCR